MNELKVGKLVMMEQFMLMAFLSEQESG